MKAMSGSTIVFSLLTYGFFIGDATAQGTFQNLDFERAVIVPIGPLYAEFSPAFPGWTGYYGNQTLTLQASQVIYNGLAIGSAQITLLGPGTPQMFPRLAGNYTAVLQSGSLGLSGGADVWLSQTGMVPAGTMSLRFLAYGNTESLSVLMAGQPLNVVPTRVVNGYQEFGADVSQFANQNVELRFIEHYRPPQNAWLDNISFSPLAVPEPSTWALLALGSALFWRVARRRRK